VKVSHHDENGVILLTNTWCFLWYSL